MQLGVLNLKTSNGLDGFIAPEALQLPNFLLYFGKHICLAHAGDCKSSHQQSENFSVKDQNAWLEVYRIDFAASTTKRRPQSKQYVSLSFIGFLQKGTALTQAGL